MKIAFARVANNEVPFEIKKEDLKFSGNLKRVSQNLIECKADIKGSLKHICDRCGEDIGLNLDENLKLIISDGIYKDSEENLDDAIEFFDGFIDLNEVFISEIEAFKSDYFYCEKCKNL